MVRLVGRLVLLVFPVAFVGCSSSKSSPAAKANEPADAAAEACAVVQTADGPVQANPTPGQTCTYLGIPFAAPPTGDLRWKPPQPVTAWTTPRPSQGASGCPQTSSEFGVASTDEDCLYLNVWSPKTPAATPAPVMVFVHGGSFLYGSGDFGLYDGTGLAESTGNIVVTLNYRLGAFGFLSHPALRAEDPANPTSGEYGILDQIAAFQWVQKNAAAFGGDPKNVTIFGESAGGTSMFLHLVSPKSAGLFQRVIVESGAAAGGSEAVPMAFGDASGAQLATALGCTDDATLLTCLRQAPVSAVLATEGMASTNIVFWPVVDGFVIPDDPVKLFDSGTINKAPVLVGNNGNEGTLFVLESPPTDDATYLAFANSIVPDQGTAIVAQYPISSYMGSYQAAAADLMTDGTFLCPSRRVARGIVATGTPVYRYDFEHVFENPPFPGLGVFHGSELVFIFGNAIAGEFGLSPDEVPLQTLMRGYWSSMAASGNPNGGGRLAWPAYDATTDPEIVLNLTPSTETAQKKAICDFWDTIEN
jgi:para-nitrobenzyl esterase